MAPSEWNNCYSSSYHIMITHNGNTTTMASHALECVVLLTPCINAYLATSNTFAMVTNKIDMTSAST